MFIGRKEELQFLEEKYGASGGQLIVLYGRRRVGKTETLRQFCTGKEHVFYSCTECTDGQQLSAFSARMLQKGIPAARYVTSFSDWVQAFKSIVELPGNEKKLLVIDEFPYMVQNNHSIPSILQGIWDSTLKNANVMLILCGSAMSFIEKEILAEKNPLYGRATGILKMNAMDFYDAVEFFPSYSALDKITAYAVLGGIPHYLKQFSDTAPLAENIEKNILTRGSILYSEVEFLMRQELRETTIYNTIIEAVALGNTKLNDIYQKTQIDKSKLTVYLKNLTDLEIIHREFSVADGVKERANLQRGLYQITDPFFRFWYAFVFPNLSELEAGDAAGVWKYIVSPALDAFVSHAFEDICRSYLRRENRSDRLPFHFSQIGRWWNKTDELDIMATDREKKKFLIGECKYKNAAFDISELNATLQKFTSPKKDSEIYTCLFSKNGFTPAAMQAVSEKGITAICAQDLFG